MNKIDSKTRSQPSIWPAAWLADLLVEGVVETFTDRFNVGNVAGSEEKSLEKNPRGEGLQILPVMDVRRGEAVHAIGGKRAGYQPLFFEAANKSLDKQKQHLQISSRGGSVGVALAQFGKNNEIYLADLDALQGEPPQFGLLQELAEKGVHLWLDLGLRNQADGQRLLKNLAGYDTSRWKFIVALESVCSESELAKLFSLFKKESAVFSLDLQQEKPRTQIKYWQQLSPVQIAGKAIRLGYQKIILLDTTRVGTGQGAGTEKFGYEILRRWPTVELIGGGGVGSVADLRGLKNAGCKRVLIGSAFVKKENRTKRE